jgi:hypothetical protein
MSRAAMGMVMVVVVARITLMVMVGALPVREPGTIVN